MTDVGADALERLREKIKDSKRSQHDLLAGYVDEPDSAPDLTDSTMRSAGGEE